MRYYLTTAIAYANNKPGLHTLYEVIGADAVARWHRMAGDEVRFLTGTDEYSVNIAARAAEERLDPKTFVDGQVEFFRASENRLLISPDRFIRTTDPDHTLAAQEMVRRSFRAGDIYLGTYEGWYCPNEGFRSATDVVTDGDATICPNHPGVPLQWLQEQNWFFRLSAYQERLEAWLTQDPSPVQPEYRRNEMLGFVRQGLEDFSISREGAGWGIPFPIRADGSSALAADGTADPSAGTIYVWYDALINYLTGAGFPADPMGAPWWPADLHIIGKDINRFHSVFWPAMLWSAGLEAPRRVHAHGWMLTSGERMSKSRGNILDPDDAVAALGADGVRFVLLREVPFDRDADVSWDSMIRRYNAELANDFGNLVNRAVTLAGRAAAGGTPPPPRAASDTPLAASWERAKGRAEAAAASLALHDWLGALWEVVGEANRFVDQEKPWELAKVAAADPVAADRLNLLLGDLLEVCRLVALYAAPVMPRASARIWTLLGHNWPYDDRGIGTQRLKDLGMWGALPPSGPLGAPEPLFPRLENDERAALTR
jgi:methionyl-tRNA synthetase